MKKLMIAFSLIALTACNSAGSGQTTQPDLADPASPIIDPDPGQPVDPGTPATPPGAVTENVTIDVYSLSRTAAPINGYSFKTYTAIGYCAEIDAKVYCWDDGEKTIDFVDNHFEYKSVNSYFEITQNVLHANTSCSGGCTIDPLDAPTYIDSTLEMIMAANAIDQVFNTGAVAHVACVRTVNEPASADIIDCQGYAVTLERAQ